MSAWRKTLIYLGLVEEPDDYDEYAERTLARGQGERPREPRREFREEAAPSHRREGPTAMSERESNVAPLRRQETTSSHVRPMTRAGMGARVQIVAIEDFETGAEEIGRQYRMGSPVLFDMTDASGKDSRRMLDFVAGVTFALRGRMEKMGSRSFLITPDGVDLSSEERQRLHGLGYGG